MIRVEPHPEGTIISVRAHAGARRNDVRGEHDGALRISVAQAPEKGKANQAIVELLAKYLQVKKSQVELLSGETNSNKRFLIRGMTVEQLQDHLLREP